jgi:hypothetical protein
MRSHATLGSLVMRDVRSGDDPPAVIAGYLFSPSLEDAIFVIQCPFIASIQLFDPVAFSGCIFGLLD